MTEEQVDRLIKALRAIDVTLLLMWFTFLYQLIFTD